MLDIAAEIRRVVDEVGPIGTDEVVATARRRRRRRRAGAGALAAAVAAAVAVVVAVVLPSGSSSRVDVGAAPVGGRPATSSVSVDGVTVRVKFDTTTVTAGGSIHGQLEIVNASGHRLIGKFCQARSFGVQVNFSSYYAPSPAFGACDGRFVIARGTSRWPLTVGTTYQSPPGVHHPLPAGRYTEAFGFAPFTPITPPTPAPIRITITSPNTNPPSPATTATGSATSIGEVVGHINACFGIPPNHVPRSVAGTVEALRGRVRSVADGPGSWRIVLPTTRVAIETVAAGHDYHFRLPPGHYVIAITKDRTTPAGRAPWRYIAATVTAGHATTASIPNTCK